MSDDDIATLSETLKILHNLSLLSLSHNNISGAGVALLAEALKAHKAFHILDLSWQTNLFSNGFDALTQLSALELQELYLEGEGVTVKGAS